MRSGILVYALCIACASAVRPAGAQDPCPEIPVGSTGIGGSIGASTAGAPGFRLQVFYGDELVDAEARTDGLFCVIAPSLSPGSAVGVFRTRPGFAPVGVVETVEDPGRVLVDLPPPEALPSSRLEGAFVVGLAYYRLAGGRGTRARGMIVPESGQSLTVGPLRTSTDSTGLFFVEIEPDTSLTMTFDYGIARDLPVVSPGRTVVIPVRLGTRRIHRP